MSVTLAVALGGALPALPAAVAAQQPAVASQEPAPATAAVDVPDDSAFVAMTRAGIARFHDRAAAIAAGYRRLGPSFPGMGEHWIHPGLIVRRTVTPGEPPVLCYAVIADEPRLVAAAYAFPLARGAPLPPLPGGSHAWHEHDGAVDEETLLLVHPAAAGTTGSGMRLVMTHVWTGLENPDGVFAQNNWRLPFVQAGIALAADPDMEAAQAMALVSAGTSYYLRLFDALAAPPAAERVAIEAVLDTARERVEAWAAALGGQPADAAALEALAVEWQRMWAELAAAVGRDRAARLHAPFDVSHAATHDTAHDP